LSDARHESDTGWAFGPFELSADGVLREDGAEVALAAKSLGVLRHLLLHRDRVVEREELLREVWPGVSVSEAAFHSAVRDLRRALGDRARSPRFVATRRGRGLQFVGEAHELPGSGPGAGWEQLAGHFERALRALEQVEASRAGAGVPRERGALLVALGRARWAAGATDDARRAFLDAAKAARRMGDAEMLAHAALGFVGRSDVSPRANADAVALLEEALAALPESEAASRSEVLARLGTELIHEADGSRARRLTEQGVAAAERSGNAPALAYALVSRHFVLRRPGAPPDARLPLCERAVALVDGGGASDVLALALQETLLDQLELGEGAAFEDTLRRYASVSEALAQPFFAFMHSILEATRLLLTGRLDDAERAAHEMLARGRECGSPNAEPAFAALLFSIRDAQGRLVQLAPLVEGLAGRAAALPITRAALAAIDAAARGREAAQPTLDAVMARGLEDFPRDENWLGVLGILAPLAAGGPHAPRLYALLRPHAGRVLVSGHGALVRGAADHHLGVLAAGLGQLESAVEHLRNAAALHARLRAPLWTRRSEEALAALA
jgi:DNA-binding winged helix-turn-helix (wHTH) protein